MKMARERAGLSLEDVASRTKIQPYKIESLESGDFGNLPEGVYLDGIVRAYAREVGIDPAPVITRVHGERSTFAAAVDTAPDALDAFPSERAASVLAHQARMELHFPEEPVAIPPAEIPVRAPQDVPEHAAEVPHPATAATVPVSMPMSAGEALLSPRLFLHEPPRRSRWPTRLAILALLLVAIAGWGAYLYEVARPFDRNAPAGIVSVPEQAATSDVPVVVEPQAGPADQTAPVGTAGVPERPTADANQPPTPGNAPVALPPEPTPATPTAGSLAAESPIGTNAPMPDVSGSWMLSTRVDRSSYAPFERLELGYEIQLQRAGGRISGGGRKVSESGRAIGSTAQTPISISGTMSGNRLTLTFTEGTAERSSPGKLVLLVEEDGAMRGRFSSSAAQSSGIVEARRMP